MLGRAHQTQDEVAATQLCLTLAERFPCQAPDVISPDRPFHQSFRYDQRKPWIPEPIDNAVEHEALRPCNAA